MSTMYCGVRRERQVKRWKASPLARASRQRRVETLIASSTITFTTNIFNAQAFEQRNAPSSCQEIVSLQQRSLKSCEPS